MSRNGVLGSVKQIGSLRVANVFTCIKPWTIIGALGQKERLKIKD
jgi:hypothetical protein